MTSETATKIRNIQTQIETSAQTATTRAEVVNLRVLWGMLQEVLDSED